ncbi:MAG: aldehyde dehydrogenase family protein [Phycisphaerales bacterium]
MSTEDSGIAAPRDMLISGTWRSASGPRIDIRNPAAPDQTVFECNAATSADIEHAVRCARHAFESWADAPALERFKLLHEYARIADSRKELLANTIRAETGKPHWDASAESALIGAKVAATLDQGPLSRVETKDIKIAATRDGRTSFRPHGVMAVIGPFNFPAHLPNGHIVPALAMGNTVIFKPSDKTPASGALIAEWMREAAANVNAPAGIITLLQGGATTAGALVSHDAIDGVLFTGSWSVGRKIIEANLDRPGRMLALEMGGNNAAVVMDDANLDQAVIECARSAFIGTGQRCTCTRRILVHRAIANQFIDRLVKFTQAIAVGDPRHEVFMGPLISESARDHVLRAQARFVQSGAEVLLRSQALDSEKGWYLTPGILRIDRCTKTDDGQGADIEVFGPLLRIAVVDSLEEAIAQCNETRYGLAAAIFSQSNESIELFSRRVRAGCVNVNCGTAGASSKLPFGGIGLSGNHRPAGAFSLDYCAYPVAHMIERSALATGHPGLPQLKSDE